MSSQTCVVVSQAASVFTLVAFLAIANFSADTPAPVPNSVIFFVTCHMKACKEVLSHTPYTPNNPVSVYCVLNVIKERAHCSLATARTKFEAEWMPPVWLRSHDPSNVWMSIRVKLSGSFHPKYEWENNQLKTNENKKSKNKTTRQEGPDTN